MMSRLRTEVQAFLRSCDTARPPFLRRSLLPDWLLCTDLPRVAAEPAVRLFCLHLEENGWKTLWEGELIQLAKRPEAPADNVSFSELTGECACAASLLRRHPGGKAKDEDFFDILKAAEAGKLEKCCASLHSRWAAALRKHEPLPGELLPWLLALWKEVGE